MSDRAIWDLPIAELDATLATMPSVVTWSRLEPLTLTSDLTPGLQTLLSDPLWMVARQWQFGELHGEDAGTPISAVVEVQQAPISRLRRGRSVPVDVVDEAMPLEARIEAEAVALPAARIRAEAGLQLVRRLAGAGFGALRAMTIERWAFETGTARYRGRVPDAQRAAHEIGALAPGAVPPGFPAGADVRAVLDDWMRWYSSYLVQTDGSAWIPRRQEYQFAVHAELPAGTVVFDAEESATGRLDWPDFTATTRRSRGRPRVRPCP